MLSKKEIEENDFRAYIASSSDSEPEDAPAASKGKKNKAAERDRLRALLLGGGDDDLPEGWGRGDGVGDDGDDVDMEITFTPALSSTKGDKDETTLEKYQRKMKEKKKLRKEEVREKRKPGTEEKSEKKKGLDDDFFDGGSDDESEAAEAPRDKKVKGKGKEGKRKVKAVDDKDKPARVESTAEELALIAASENPDAEIKHFDMKAVLRSEKRGGRKKRGKKGKKGAEDEAEVQEEFAIDVKDDRFKAVLEDHTYAIDPSNPQ